MGLGNNPDDPAEKLADELVDFVGEQLPCWRDNGPYYALFYKARELFHFALTGSRETVVDSAQLKLGLSSGNIAISPPTANSRVR